MNKNTVGKDAATLTVAKIITTLIGLVSTMLLSRFRTLEEYGTYSQILIVITIAISVFTLGLPNSTNYFLARAEGQQERRQFLSVYYSLNTILCLLIGVALALSVPAIVAYFDNSLIRDFMYFLEFLPWTVVIISSISNVLVVYGQTKKLTLFNTVNACTTLASILIVQLFHWSFREFMFLYLVGQFGMMLWVYIMVWNLEKSLRFWFDKQLIKTIFQYSIPIGLASITGTISIEIDKLMVGKLFDTESLAIYTNAGKELPLTIVAASLTAVLLPQLARLLKNNKIQEAIDLWGESIELSYIILAFCVTACIVFAPQIITVLYSEKYLSGTNVFRIYSMVLLLRVTYFGILLNSIGRTKFIFYCSLASLGLNVLLNYLLYLSFGFVGPAIATFCSISLVNILQLYVTGKVIGIKLKKLFPWEKLFQYSLINVAWGTSCYTIIKALHLGTSMKDILICIIMGCCVTALYFWAVRNNIKLCWRGLNNT